MSTVDRMLAKFLECPEGNSFLTEDYSAARRWNGLKQHALICSSCRDALMEYQHLSGATVLLPMPLGKL